MSGSAEWGGMPMQEAIAFLRQKVRLPSTRYDDLEREAHVRAFSVAGIQADDMLADLQGALIRSRESGKGFAEFRRDIGETIAKTGWADRGADYVSWRTRLIYDTNVRVSQAAGRYAQMTEPETLEALPYWLYRHNPSQHPRKHHEAWDGTVLPADDVWWKTHYAPNGWGCQCQIEAISRRDLRRMGMQGPSRRPDDGTRRYVDPVTGEARQVPVGIDPGWDYNPGESWLHGAVPTELQEPLRPRAEASEAQVPAALPPMPTPRPFDRERLLPESTSAEQAAAAFLGEFGATMEKAVVYRDVTGARITVGHDLFVTASGKMKADKRGRAPWMRLLADAVRDPDEVWVDFELGRKSGEVILKRRYLRRFAGADGAEGLAVFEWGWSGWRGTTAFPPDKAAYLEALRRGALLYRRREG
ncbi:PBECR2 nuclease fold domain-containing protein [Pararoseomonas sp. SCSIO 73927]|uniref:PBECR2 nuclease fold domain-containing protein n=1 Tax=Pararoseomonas sp. SCSIO 73927 TaxID=3114537 RepID=UPI0030D3A6A6